MKEPAEETSHRPAIIAGGISAAVILYFLSVGPAMMIALHHHSLIPAFETAYSPLYWLSNHVPGIQKALLAYISLWVDIPP